METKYYTNNTFHQFKSWVKTLCMSNKYYFYHVNTAHAIFSAYYIFKHHLKDQEIIDFLDTDFNSSMKAFKRYGGVEINENIEEISKKVGYDFHIDDMTLLNRPGKYYLDTYSNELETENARESWHLHVMAIYNYWHNKALKEAKIGRPSKYAFKETYKSSSGENLLDGLNDVENMVWYCIKHNLSIEKAAEYIKNTLERRSRINKMTTRLLSGFNAYYFKDILKIDNSFFNVYERDNKVYKFKGRDAQCQYVNYKNYDGNITAHDITYDVKKKTSNGYHTLDEICDVVTEMTMKIYDYYKICPNYNGSPKVLFSMHKTCNRTEWTFDENEAIKLDDTYYITKKRPDIVNSTVEPITGAIWFYSYLPTIDLSTDITEEFRKRREMYFNMTMFVFLLYKSLDYVEEHKDISYEEYCKPIYVNEEIKPIDKTNVKQSTFKSIVNKIIKK